MIRPISFNFRSNSLREVPQIVVTGALALSIIALSACGKSDSADNSTDAAGQTSGEAQSNVHNSYVPVCDRTQAVQEQISQRLMKVCQQITPADVASILSLDLSSLSLGSIREGDLSGLTGMTEVYLNDNQLTTIPEFIFAGLTNLQYIDLSHNQLTGLSPATFSGLSNIQELNITYNDLTTLPPTLLNGLTRMERISVASNRLTNLPNSFFNGLSALSSIDITNNAITDVPSALLAGLPSLQEVLAEGNPITDETYDRIRNEETSDPRNYTIYL